MQQHIAQQAAFSQIPDVVKGVSWCVCWWKRALMLRLFHFSSSFTSTKQSLTTILQRLPLLMRVDGTSTRKNSMPGRNGRRRRLLHLWSTTVSPKISYSVVSLNLAWRPHIPHPLPWTLLSSRILTASTKCRWPIPLIREQLWTFQLPSELVVFPSLQDFFLNFLQTPRGLLNFNYLNNGCGTSSTSSSINSKYFAPGDRKSNPRLMTSSRCWQKVAP